MFIEIDGEENVLLLVKVRSYTDREKSNPTNAVFLSRYMMCHIPGACFSRVTRFEQCVYYAKNVRAALLIGCLYRGTQKPKIKISVAVKVSFPNPRGGRIVAIMSYTERLRSKGVAFSVIGYINEEGFH